MVTVIVPVYNVEKYLRKCVDSIIHQTYSNLEIILVDDGSTDHSGVLCDELSLTDSRIRIIHKPNGGLSDARNAGIDAASGDWLSFIDSDDYITEDTVETLLDAAVSGKAEIAICNMKRFFDSGKTAGFYEPVHEMTVLKGMDRFQTLKQPSVCNKLFRADLFQDIRFPKGKFYEDTFVYHELLFKATNVVLTGKTGYWYLSREGSILGRPAYTARYFDFIEAVYQRMCFLITHHIQPYADEACLSMYAAMANAEKYIRKEEQSAAQFKKARTEYEKAYQQLINNPGISRKQRIRLRMLRNHPALHSKIYMR